MRRATSLERSIDLLFTSSSVRLGSSSVCRVCLAQRATARISSSHTAPFSSSARHRASDESTPSFTERWRRRIWGTDKPPGPADPYKRVQATEVDVPQVKQEPLEEEPLLEEETKRKTKAQRRQERDIERGGDVVYQPALTWDGLQSVGWTKEERADRLAPGNEFRGFLPSTRTTSPPEVTLSLYRALVETYSLVHNSMPLSTLSSGLPDAHLIPRTSSVRFEMPAGHSTPMLEYPNEDVRQEILSSLQQSKPIEKERPIEEDVEDLEAKSTLVPENNEHTLEEEVARLGQAWLRISLQDPAMKFAVIKRTTQLTGIILPDPALPYILTTESLLNILLELVAPKPQTTYDALVANEELKGMTNVKIVGRRVTPVDREKEVGRWKGIVRELERRDLPVLGHKHLV